MKALLHRLRLDTEIPIPALGPVGRYVLAVPLLTIFWLCTGSTLLHSIAVAALLGLLIAAPEFDTRRRQTAECERPVSRWRRFISLMTLLFAGAMIYLGIAIAGAHGIGFAVICLGGISALMFTLSGFFAVMNELAVLSFRAFRKARLNRSRSTS